MAFLMATPAHRPRIQPWSLWLVAALLLGGVLVSVNYVKRNRAEARDFRPPYLGKLERDLAAENWDGSPVHLAGLKGRIWVASHLYTGSPAKGEAVLQLLQSLANEFGSDPRLHFVIFSVDPEMDTQEKRREFLRRSGVDESRWWFLTARREEMARYVVRYLRLMPSHPATVPERVQEWGAWEHDVRVVLIDGKANLRGQYQLLLPAIRDSQLARLRRDLAYLLEERPEASPTPR